MKRNKNGKDHPEIHDIKNICDISPDTKKTKTVCEKIKKEKDVKSSKNI